MRRRDANKLFDEYARRLRDGLGAKADRFPAEQCIFPADEKALLAHALFMCEEAVTFSDAEKKQRWLGFVQGTMWTLGIYSVSDLKRHVTDMLREEA
jgi:hypothetical protein